MRQMSVISTIENWEDMAVMFQRNGAKTHARYLLAMEAGDTIRAAYFQRMSALDYRTARQYLFGIFLLRNPENITEAGFNYD